MTGMLVHNTKNNFWHAVKILPNMDKKSVSLAWWKLHKKFVTTASCFARIGLRREIEAFTTIKCAYRLSFRPLGLAHIPAIA